MRESAGWGSTWRTVNLQGRGYVWCVWLVCVMVVSMLLSGCPGLFESKRKNTAPELNPTSPGVVNESEEFNYQVNATDSDGDTLTYSLTQSPDWMSIDSSTGLITGTAPEVDSDTVSSARVVVSDTVSSDSQMWDLTVLDKSPRVTQTASLAEGGISINYSAELSNITSATLEVYRNDEVNPAVIKDIHMSSSGGGDSGGSVSTSNLTTSSINDIFQDTFNCLDDGITKGDYRFVLRDNNSDFEDTLEKNSLVPNYLPEVDLSSVDFNLLEEISKTIQLPSPTDKNPEDNPTYSGLGAEVSVFQNMSLNGNQLTLQGNTDRTGNFSLELYLGNSETGENTMVTNGNIQNLIDISGSLEDNETQSAQSGVIRIYDSSGNQIKNLKNNSDGSTELEEILVSSSGDFNFQINQQVPEAIIQGRMGSEGNWESYVRSVRESGDNVNLTLRVIPHAGIGDLNEDGDVLQQGDIQMFRDFLGDMNFPYIGFPYPWQGLAKWDINNMTDTPLLGVKIYTENEYGPEYGEFTQNEINNLMSRILDENDIGSFLPGTNLNIEVTTPDLEYDGWITLEPFYDLDWQGLAVTKTYGNGFFKCGHLKLKVPLIGNEGLTSSTPPHEFGHATIAPRGHPTYQNPGATYGGVSNKKSLMVIPTNFLYQPTDIDTKATDVVYEDTYMAGERLEDILGMEWGVTSTD